MGKLAAHPCPEIVAPGAPFTVRPTDAVHIAHTSRASRCFEVPYSGDPAAVRAIRAHELGHLRYSPSKPRPKRFKVSPEALFAAEDGRVNLLLARAGVNLSALPAGPFPEAVNLKDPLLLFQLAALAVARLGTGACQDTTRAWIESVVPSDYLNIIVDTVNEAVELFEDSLNFSQSVTVARLLDSLRPPVACIKGKPGKDIEQAETGPGWGDMTIETPPLSKSVVSRLRERCSRTEGDFPTAMHRYCSDGAIFQATRTRRTCTVLIDCSGSMHWGDGLAATLAQCSGATIALYAGHSDGETGTLRVVAAHGRMVSDPALLKRLGGNNTIDGPALAWLGRQPGPRLWVSDGKVVGRGRKQTPALFADALHLCRAHDITRVMPSQLAQALKRV